MLGFVLGWTSSSCDSSGPRLLSVSFRRGVPTLLTPRKRRARLTRDSLKEREGRRARRVRDATARAARFERHPSESLASASRLAASWSSQIGSIPIILGNGISVTRRSAPCRRARRADSRATPTAPPVAGAPTEPPSPAPRPSTFPGGPFRAIHSFRLREGTIALPVRRAVPRRRGAPRTYRRRPTPSRDVKSNATSRAVPDPAPVTAPAATHRPPLSPTVPRRRRLRVGRVQPRVELDARHASLHPRREETDEECLRARIRAEPL